MCCKIDRVKSVERLKLLYSLIVFESEDDDGAAEHWGEIEHIIAMLEGHETDDEIRPEAEGLCLSHMLVSGV